MAVFFLFLRNVLLQIEILKLKIPEHSDPPSQHFFVRKAFSHFYFRRGKVMLCHLAEWHIQGWEFQVLKIYKFRFSEIFEKIPKNDTSRKLQRFEQSNLEARFATPMNTQTAPNNRVRNFKQKKNKISFSEKVGRNQKTSYLKTTKI